MSSIETFQEPELENYEYTPIKINKIDISPQGSTISRIYIFIGNVPLAIQKILDKHSAEKDLTKNDHDALRDHFGKNYKETLLIKANSQHGGANNDGDDEDADDELESV